MKLLFNLAWLSLAAGATIRSPQPVTYDGYQVHRLRAAGRDLALAKRAMSSIPHETLNEARGSWDVLIAPEQLDAFNALGLKSRTLHENLAHSIARESHIKNSWKRQSNGSDDAWFDSYHAYEDHITWWRDLQSSFPGNSNWTSTGTSYEGRDMFGVHFWGADGPGKKPAVVYHGTVHAREWITAPVIEYIAKQLVDGYKAGDNETKSFLDKYDFYMFPIVNPDGFVFSQTDNRLWRKNRQPPPANAQNQTCYGRDINRNWETNWDSSTRGASRDPCSQTYRGEAPRDTPENLGMDLTIRKIRDQQGIELYIDWHSYSQLILFPFGDKEMLYAPELGMWTKTASLMSEQIRLESKNDTTYVFGPSGATLYPTTGASIDHVYSTGRARFSMTIELPDTGDYGFVLPPERIRPAAEEQWVGQRVLLTLLDEPFFDGEGPAIGTW
jgi:murein tripeptide amidase MpaA